MADQENIFDGDLDLRGADIVEKDGDDLFLSLVKERPCIYDLKNADYKDNNIKQRAFEEIGEILQLTGIMLIY